MPRAPGNYLNPREQQIMEIVFQQQRVTAAELEELLPGRPSNSTVRTQLRILEQRGHLTHVEEDGRFIYTPATPRANAAMTAMEGLLKTFFQGSVEQAFLTLLSRREAKLSPDELDRLARIIEDAKKEETRTQDEDHA